MNNNYFLLAAGVGLFTAYCIYFDRKRTSAPDYKEKVKAKRAIERAAKAREQVIDFPDKDDKHACEAFFVKHIQIGEDLLTSDVDRAVKHLCYSIIFCPQSENLLSYFREVLPTDIFQKIIESLGDANNEALKSTQGNLRVSIEEEDVE